MQMKLKSKFYRKGNKLMKKMNLFDMFKEALIGYGIYCIVIDLWGIMKFTFCDNTILTKIDVVIGILFAFSIYINLYIVSGKITSSQNNSIKRKCDIHYN